MFYYTNGIRLISYLVPPAARMNGVKLRWWQSNDSAQTMENWAIDSVITDSPLRLWMGQFGQLPLNGKQETVPPVSPADNRRQDLYDRTRLWWRWKNIIRNESVCGEKGYILQGTSNAQQESLMETNDFVLTDERANYLAFKLMLGACATTWPTQPVPSNNTPLRFQVSFDHGVTWQLFHTLQLRGQSAVAPQMQSVFFANERWQHVVYSLQSISNFRCACDVSSLLDVSIYKENNYCYLVNYG